jgi:trans-aconitate methyltransferase
MVRMREHPDREHLRLTFGRVASLYDRARPSYPSELFDDLRTLTEGGRLLEIGCGSGQATRDLVARGFDVTCVDLSPELAELARRNVPEAELVVADVEEWHGPEFDVVASFTAFHWLAPETRYGTAARLLRPGGALAVVHTHHVRNDDPFWLASQADYDEFFPREDGRPMPLPDEVTALEVDHELFEPVTMRRYAVETAYAPDEYIELVSTYSDYIALPAARRDELLARVRARVAEQGGVRKLVLYELTLARRR